MNNLWKTIHLRIDSYSLMNKNIHHYEVIDMCMNIQDKVIYLSNNRGLTQQQISERTGISQSSVSKIASGEQKEVAYNKGVALDALVASEQNREYEESKTKQLNRSA